jgi:hypothetical protein
MVAKCLAFAAESDDALSDGGTFYNDMEFRRPVAIPNAIPVVKSPQVRYIVCIY